MTDLLHGITPRAQQASRPFHSHSIHILAQCPVRVAAKQTAQMIGICVEHFRQPSQRNRGRAVAMHPFQGTTQGGGIPHRSSPRQAPPSRPIILHRNSRRLRKPGRHANHRSQFLPSLLNVLTIHQGRTLQTLLERTGIHSPPRTVAPDTSFRLLLRPTHYDGTVKKRTQNPSPNHQRLDDVGEPKVTLPHKPTPPADQKPIHCVLIREAIPPGRRPFGMHAELAPMDLPGLRQNQIRHPAGQARQVRIAHPPPVLLIQEGKKLPEE